MRCTLMRRYSPGPVPRLQRALVDQPAHELDGAVFGDQRGVEGDLVDAVDDLLRRLRRRRPQHRIDLHHQHVLGRRWCGRTDRSAGWRCSRRPSRARRRSRPRGTRNGSAADAITASASIFSRGNTRSRPVCTLVAAMNSGMLAFLHRVEIDEADDQVLQRIDVERIEIVGRQIARHRVEPGLDRRRRRSGSARTAGRRSTRLSVDMSPSRLAARQKSASRLRASSRPAAGEPVGHHHRVDRAGRGAGNALDLDPAVVAAARRARPR